MTHDVHDHLFTDDSKQSSLLHVSDKYEEIRSKSYMEVHTGFLSVSLVLTEED